MLMSVRQYGADTCNVPSPDSSHANPIDSNTPFTLSISMDTPRTCFIRLSVMDSGACSRAPG